MNEEFEKLKGEIDRFYNFLEYLSLRQIGLGNDEYKVVDCNILEKEEFDSLFKSMKSNLVIMLYNLVESTVRLTMYGYYDNFNNTKKAYKNVTEEVRKVWIKYSSKTFNENKIQQQVFEMIESAIDKEYFLELDSQKFHLSGNADTQEIKEILKVHGLKYDETNFKNCGWSLKSIKDMRNSLAHGNISFEDNGKTLAISDIKLYKEQTYECLTYFMEVVDNAISTSNANIFLSGNQRNKSRHQKIYSSNNGKKRRRMMKKRT
ncbi:MAE_28990/MAE_18760 family HEPN-like nuclease [Lactococcus cremoris]|uniref:MAE_28990/MAE_18760 family HEPN-like nuclease n=1 Tax=Lactococcus lactis subsp. cremoris TaxID=1359 RepID=UPI0003AB69A2|nr:MAE_28990/MAE_18760 family HEPN-like nuclease [Lactococcus cremoris]AGV74224.1 hypothetical protein kw2_2295 [Lactococcus cremoris subsp. cremoris KW2]